jgi:hypothetical protein
LPSDFVELAGRLWLDAKRKDRLITVEELRRIAETLDRKGYVPPAEYLEKKCANDLKSYNSRNSNSNIGPLKTWSRLISVADKDHMRGMRKLLSRCAQKCRLQEPAAVRK